MEIFGMASRPVTCAGDDGMVFVASDFKEKLMMEQKQGNHVFSDLAQRLLDAGYVRGQTLDQMLSVLRELDVDVKLTRHQRQQFGYASLYS